METPASARVSETAAITPGSSLHHQAQVGAADARGAASTGVNGFSVAGRAPGTPAGAAPVITSAMSAATAAAVGPGARARALDEDAADPARPR